tara:strand:- start:896 stop:1072 length:177 start_codon:yes stop_codon:yes gene_type:complete
MVINNCKNSLAESKRFNADNIINKNNGITKRLLEKYKTKINYNIGRARNRKDQENVAY